MFLLEKLLTLFCIIVCSYQLYLTTVDYLEYNVVTLLDIDFPDWFTAPDVTLCVQFIDAVNWTAWTIHHPDLLPDNCTIIDDDKENRSKHIRQCFTEMGKDDFEGFVERHFNVAKFYKIIIKAESLFIDITFYNKTGYFNGLQRNHEVFCTTRTYLRDPHVCYHVACRNGTNPSDYARFNRKRLIHAPNLGILYILDLHNEIFQFWDHVFVYIHSPLDLPRGPIHSYTFVKPKEKPSLFLISFVSMNDSLLEPPYATNCRNYHDDVEGTRSLMHKYEKCLNNQTLQLNPGFLMYQTMIENPQEVEANFSNRLRYKYKDKLNEIRTECGKLVEQPECKSLYFIPYIVGYERFLIVNENIPSIFTIFAPTNPDIKLVKSPAVLLETYVVNIGSILGIWFGFSMVNLLGSLGNHLLKLKNISNFAWYNILHLHEGRMKAVNLNGEQMDQKQNNVERPTIMYYRTYGLSSRFRAAIPESRSIIESRRSQSIRPGYFKETM
uniref:Uncharacterized protein n=1 Tax=Tetranychus urticae TaxID=32264 RepID=T1JPW5_TETUR